MNSEEHFLSVRDLHVTYAPRGAAVPAVRGVDLDLHPGETLGLAGESGCGKSSMAAALLRLLPKGTKVTGEVLLDGEDVLKMKPGRLRAVRWTDLAIVFQGALHTLNPVQRVGDQIGEAIRLHSKDGGGKVSARVGELLELVGLPARRASAYPHELSGGQRQRVLIGLALACEPRLLVADEPTTALDVMVQAQVLRLLQELQQEFGLGIIFITHDLSTLADLSDRIAVMYAGRIVEQGPAEQVFTNAAHPVHPRARRRLPGDRRPGVPHEPVRRCGRPARPAPPAERLPVPPALRIGDRHLLVHGRGALAGRRRPGRRLRARLRGAGGERMNDDAPLLEVRGLHVAYRAGKTVARAVDGVDLSMKSGEIVALVGESGCGKTTLARTIMGLRVPDEGEVRFRGEPLGRDRASLREHRRHAQMIFQDPTGALNARQTIYEAVAEGVRIQKIQGDEEQLVADALSRAGLRPPESFFTRYPYEISGGQRQRVIIAGAMVLNPGLLVADEPVSALDASVRGEILALMLKLVRETGVGILVVTHDLGLAWNVANRVAVMYLGRIVEEGPTEKLLTAPKHPYTRALLSVVPEVEEMEQQILTGEAPDPTRIPAGCRFHPRCPVVETGEAERLGILERCRSDDPLMLPACHAVALAATSGETT